MGRTACTEPQCLYKGALYLYSRAIPLLPLWAVWPVQSLSACTRVHFTLQYSYTSTPPVGRTACTEPQCLYKGALYSIAIPLLPLWAVWPVQSLSACTRVHFNFTVELYLYSPLWVVRPLQSFSACTRVHFTFTFTLHLYGSMTHSLINT